MIEDLILKFNRECGVTVIMSTHDMQQGQRLAARVGVLMEGELVQVGRPAEIFQSPGNIRVAGFVGIRNILHGTVESNMSGIAVIGVQRARIEAVSELPPGSGVDIYIRPEDIVLSSLATSGSARNTMECVIGSVRAAGSLTYVDLDCGIPLEALVTARSSEEMDLQPGKRVFASFKATAVKVLKG
jgi:tungstate transport system ATP-binding protein